MCGRRLRTICCVYYWQDYVACVKPKQNLTKFVVVCGAQEEKEFGELCQSSVKVVLVWNDPYLLRLANRLCTFVLNRLAQQLSLQELIVSKTTGIGF